MSEALTFQSIFNDTCGLFKTQGVRSKREGSCVYRGPGGRRCAIGNLIEDKDYTPKMEGNTIYGLFDNSYAPQNLTDFVNTYAGRAPKEFLSAIQGAHDGAYSGLLSEYTAKSMRLIADHYGLDASKVDWWDSSLS